MTTAYARAVASVVGAVLINVPIIFYILKVRALRRGSLKPSVGG
jgi:hypothetical protein